ncbi:MAG: hypothetical protein R3B35_12315 [Gemmatimonadales bacterium]
MRHMTLNRGDAGHVTLSSEGASFHGQQDVARLLIATGSLLTYDASGSDVERAWVLLRATGDLPRLVSHIAETVDSEIGVEWFSCPLHVKIALFFGAIEMNADNHGRSRVVAQAQAAGGLAAIAELLEGSGDGADP